LLFIVPRVRLTRLYAMMPTILLTLTLSIAFSSRDEINRILSQRPSYYRLFLEDLNLSDFVLSAPVKSTSYPVDNSYIHLAVGAGAFTLTAFLILFYRAVHSLMLHGRYAEVAFLVTAAAYCASESLIVRIELVWIVYMWHLLLRWGATPAPSGAARVCGDHSPVVDVTRL
jgi:hypothetical protein